MTLADDPARLRILTDLDATLLVEAAAGTGNTTRPRSVPQSLKDVHAFRNALLRIGLE